MCKQFGIFDIDVVKIAKITDWFLFILYWTLLTNPPNHRNLRHNNEGFLVKIFI